MFSFICGVFSAICEVIRFVVVDKFIAFISGPIVMPSALFI
jgi:hypothetical protein